MNIKASLKLITLFGVMLPTLVFPGIVESLSSHSVEPPSSQLKEDTLLYRKLVTDVRLSDLFQVPMPGSLNIQFDYSLKIAAPAFPLPKINDFYIGAGTDRFIRDFWDKIYLDDASYLNVNGDHLPLTCIYVRGQDNRYTNKDSPLVPDFILRFYLVANDFTCTGPINPGWPDASVKKETWETYLYFEVRDPTIMMPTEIKLRYRWNEMPAIILNQGRHP